MAAVETPESPKRRRNPAEDVGASAGRSGAAEPACSPEPKGRAACTGTARSRDSEPRRGSGGGDGGCVASHSDAGVEPKTTFNSASAEKMAEEESGSERRDSDWSEAGDEAAEEGTAAPREQATCDANNVTENADKVQQDDTLATSEKEEKAHEEDGSPRITEKDPAGQPMEESDRIEDNEADGEDDGVATRQKNGHLLCSDCGKTFNQREAFDLHLRHFHAHKDNLSPLTCKECDLTFEHRSALIKHSSEHREELQRKEESYECAECGSIFSTVFKLRDHSCSNTDEKPYHCPLCRQDFQFKVSVSKHMLTHSQEKMFACQECNETFPNTTALRCHQRCHSALKPYECPECGMVFKHYSVMEDHRRKHTDSTRSHHCNICGKTFKYSSLLHQHQFLHTGQKPFQCPECGKKFAFAQNMKAHCRQHRLSKTSASNTEQPCREAPPPAQDTAKELEKENSHQSQDPKCKLKCPFCPKSFSLPGELKTHMLTHESECQLLDQSAKEKNNEKGSACPHCPCIYHNKSGLKKHILSAHKDQAQYLEKAESPTDKQLNSLSSDNAQAHVVRDVLSIKSYKCSECGKAFRHRSVLELHMRIHSKDRPYQCKECGKAFRFNSYLQQHVIIHTGQKPYKCSDCGKEFAFLQNMRTHQKLHQEKPFRCTSCRKGYSDELQLQHHMLSHNGDKPHKCDLCDKSFGLAYLLRDHMNTHTGERPHRCDECDKTFSWFSSLLVHQKIHARKRQSLSQYSALSMGAQMRGSSSSAKRGGRLAWDWSRPMGGSGMDKSQSHPYPVSTLRDSQMSGNRVQPQTSILAPRVDLQSKQQQKEQGMSGPNAQPVQWKVDGGEIRPIPSAQQKIQAVLQQATLNSSPQPVLQQLHYRVPDNAAPTLSSHQPPTAKQMVSEMDQLRQVQSRPITWCNTPTTIVVASTSTLPQNFSVASSYIDGAALWSVRPTPILNSQSSPNVLGQDLRWLGAPVATQIEPSTPLKKEDNRTWDIGARSQAETRLVSGSVATTSSQIDQSSAMPSPTPVTRGVGSTFWDFKTLPGIPKTKSSPDKLVNNLEFQLQQKQGSPGWVSLQNHTAAQQVPISTPYDPLRFGQSIGTSVWGFQSNPVGHQTLLSGQLKPGNGQQQPMLTGTQLIINQPSPFLPPLTPIPPLALPGAHPLHSVGLTRPAQSSIFFTPQSVMTERPHIPQTLLAARTEPHKLAPRLPFATERLLQCMICGRSFPRELELQMHYLQHAQGEI